MNIAFLILQNQLTSFAFQEAIKLLVLFLLLPLGQHFMVLLKSETVGSECNPNAPLGLLFQMSWSVDSGSIRETEGEL